MSAGPRCLPTLPRVPTTEAHDTFLTRLSMKTRYMSRSGYLLLIRCSLNLTSTGISHPGTGITAFIETLAAAPMRAGGTAAS
ncbi:hypothetical protein SAMN04488061_2562 [Filomicrobium insigne]|uniref:Uncharacterized protein n=1 Tax=Filomicrobium insigne TaxID=418854 RepID=A0A1H0R095_9HYPH|nr:hypothetical protein SAMN04488061_2562 [Filomicrobium insigne]